MSEIYSDASDSRLLRGLLELEQSLLRSHVTLKVRVHLRIDEVHLTSHPY